ncbi:MAG: hypothetical protein C5B59_06530 [Bacteroidetes bacterium]|nr:MAG: hypothetical protein C5B59_06530 [Bacteroidota bacterium]
MTKGDLLLEKLDEALLKKAKQVANTKRGNLSAQLLAIAETIVKRSNSDVERELRKADLKFAKGGK